MRTTALAPGWLLLLLAALPVGAQPVAVVDLTPDGQSSPELTQRARQTLVGQQAVLLPAGTQVGEALTRPPSPSEDDTPAAVSFAQQALEAAQGDYSQFRYEAAISRAGAAEQRLTTVMPTGAATSLLADVELLLGVLHAESGHRVLALSSFARVRALRPELRALDAVKYRPAIVSLYAQSAPKGHAMLAVNSPTPGAAVYLDGRPLENPGVARAVSSGPHFLFVAADGYVSHGKLLSVPQSGELNPAEPLLPLTDAQKAATLRARLSESLSVESLARLCTLAQVSALVLVRPGQGGVLAWAAFHAGEAQLPRWTEGAVMMSPAPPYLPTRSSPAATAQSSNETPWYKNGWVWGASAAVLAGAGATVYLLSQSHTSYQVSSWCLNGKCSP